MIKANRTPHHQPEGSPEYADHPSLTPLPRGFFFSGRSGRNAIISTWVASRTYMLLRAAERVVPGVRIGQTPRATGFLSPCSLGL